MENYVDMKWTWIFITMILLSNPFATVLFGNFVGSGYRYFKSMFYEVCDDKWVRANLTGLKVALQNRLYGQHLIIDNVVRALKAHLENPDPTKALVMSFHGWTGGGKNYVSQIIADHLFKKGTSSDYYHLYLSSFHFPHPQHILEYQVQLQSSIRGNVSKCERSLFVFDELDKLNPDILNTLKPFLDHYDHIDGVDYRKSIFIFLSNTAGNDITQKTLDHWQKGKQRTDIKLSDMESVIHMAAFNEDGGLRFSELIKNHLIDHFLPFLPLERNHIRLCIRDYFHTKSVWYPTDDQITKVENMLQYFPKGVEIYSASGCKRVAQKVDLYLEEIYEEMEAERERKTFQKERTRKVEL